MSIEKINSELQIINSLRKDGFSTLDLDDTIDTLHIIKNLTIADINKIMEVLVYTRKQFDYIDKLCEMAGAHPYTITKYQLDVILDEWNKEVGR